jgi:hypothetical protein
MFTPTIKHRIAHHCCLIYERNVEIYVYFSGERRWDERQTIAREQNVSFNKMYSDPTAMWPLYSHALVNSTNSELNKEIDSIIFVKRTIFWVLTPCSSVSQEHMDIYF